MFDYYFGPFLTGWIDADTFGLRLHSDISLPNASPAGETNQRAGPGLMTKTKHLDLTSAVI